MIPFVLQSTILRWPISSLLWRDGFLCRTGGRDRDACAERIGCVGLAAGSRTLHGLVQLLLNVLELVGPQVIHLSTLPVQLALLLAKV